MFLLEYLFKINMNKTEILSKPVTETENQITINIDKTGIVQGLELLQDVDLEIFNDLSNTKIQELANFINLGIKVLKKKDGVIILQGAGTSGRFAVFLTNEYNKLFKINKLKGIIAGGYTALLKPKESAEDNAIEGISDFYKALGKSKNALYLGISCAGTAKCNLGPLYEIKKKKLNVKEGLMYFNSIDTIINKEISELNTDARNIIKNIDYKINPYLGPEGITGSTRLKGASATQIFLDISFYIMGLKLGYIENKELKNKPIKDIIILLINEYKKSYKIINKQTKNISKIIKETYRAMYENAHIYYIGENQTGILGVIDASECLPTFGVEFDTVRGYLAGGYNRLLTPEQIKVTNKEFMEENKLSLEDFRKIKLYKNDIVIPIINGNPSADLLKTIDYVNKSNAIIVGHILINSKYKPKSKIKTKIEMKHNNKAFNQYTGFERSLTKWVLNLITTETFVYSGKTWKNRMIDLRLSNQKLINRAINQVIKVVTKEMGFDFSEEQIIKELNKNTNIYLNQKNPLDKKLEPVFYFKINKLIPTTILTLIGIPYNQARKELNKERSIRKVIEKYKK